MDTTISNLEPKETYSKKAELQKTVHYCKLENLLVPEDFSDETSSDFNIVIFFDTV